jgi:hypothetical protein
LNELEIHFCGMSRSGNHALAEWIFDQARTPKLLLNAAEGGTNPFLTCRPLASGKGWRAEPEIDIEAARRGRFAPQNLLMHTYEDSPLDYAFSEELERHHDEWLGRSRRRIDLLVVRDPYNLFASRLRLNRYLPPDVATAIWKQHAREALGETQILPQERLVVLYNQWTRDPGYRREIARHLDIRFSDEIAQRVRDCAGGSSFDGLAFDGQASEMATGERWKAYVGNEEYRGLFDSEMAELAERLFGMAAPFAVDRERTGR